MTRKSPKCKIGFPCISRSRLSSSNNKVAETFSQFINRIVGISNSFESSLPFQKPLIREPNNLEIEELVNFFKGSKFFQEYIPGGEKYKSLYMLESLAWLNQAYKSTNSYGY